jgi:hypothetical protein
VGGMPALETDPPPDYCGERSATMHPTPRTRAQRIATERRDNHQAARPDASNTRTPDQQYSNTGPAPPDDDPPPF